RVNGENCNIVPVDITEVFNAAEGELAICSSIQCGSTTDVEMLDMHLRSKVLGHQHGALPISVCALILLDCVQAMRGRHANRIIASGEDNKRISNNLRNPVQRGNQR